MKTFKTLALPLLALCAFHLNPAQAESDIPEVKQVSSGIYRGSRPNESKFENLSENGVRTVIDLQGRAGFLIPGETSKSRLGREHLATEMGLRYFNIPTTLSSLDEDEQDDMLKIVALMADRDLQPVYVHCAAGVDRTGVIVALYRILYEGCSYKKARKEMLRHGRPWTAALMHRQMKFLKDMEERRDEIVDEAPLACPL